MAMTMNDGSRRAIVSTVVLINYMYTSYNTATASRRDSNAAPIDRVIIINNDIIMMKNRHVYLSLTGWGFRRISKFPVH